MVLKTEITIKGNGLKCLVLVRNRRLCYVQNNYRTGNQIPRGLRSSLILFQNRDYSEYLPLKKIINFNRQVTKVPRWSSVLSTASQAEERGFKRVFRISRAEEIYNNVENNSMVCLKFLVRTDPACVNLSPSPSPRIRQETNAQHWK